MVDLNVALAVKVRLSILVFGGWNSVNCSGGYL